MSTAIDRFDTAVDCLGRQPLLHVWWLAAMVGCTGKGTGITPNDIPGNFFHSLIACMCGPIFHICYILFVIFHSVAKLCQKPLANSQWRLFSELFHVYESISISLEWSFWKLSKGSNLYIWQILGTLKLFHKTRFIISKGVYFIPTQHACISFSVTMMNNSLRGINKMFLQKYFLSYA